MPTESLLRRIERMEQAATAQARFSPECICFPENEPPFFSWPIEEQVAIVVKCPLHGDRFKPRRFWVYVSKWLRDAQPKHLWSARGEQYRRAWFASFPSQLWPAQEETEADGKIFLKLKDGTRLPTS